MGNNLQESSSDELGVSLRVLEPTVTIDTVMADSDKTVTSMKMGDASVLVAPSDGSSDSAHC